MPYFKRVELAGYGATTKDKDRDPFEDLLGQDLMWALFLYPVGAAFAARFLLGKEWALLGAATGLVIGLVRL